MHHILFVLQVWRAGEEKNSETLDLICRPCGSTIGKLKCPSDSEEKSGREQEPRTLPCGSPHCIVPRGAVSGDRWPYARPVLFTSALGRF